MTGWRYVLWLLVHPSQWAVAATWPDRYAVMEATAAERLSDLRALEKLLDDHQTLQAMLADQARLAQLIRDQARLDELVGQQVEVLAGLKEQSLAITDLMASIRTVAIPKEGPAPQIRYPRAEGMIPVRFMDANERVCHKEMLVNRRRRTITLEHDGQRYRAARQDADGAWIYRQT